MLPQEDPTVYDSMIDSFNRPVLVNGKVEVDPRDFLRAAKQETLRARPGNSPDSGHRP